MPTPLVRASLSGQSRAEADVRDYSEAFHNPTRRHSHLDGVSPEQFEAAHRRTNTGCPLDAGSSIGRSPVPTTIG